MLDAGNSDGTRFNRYNGLKAFSGWAAMGDHGRNLPPLNPEVMEVSSQS